MDTKVIQINCRTKNTVQGKSRGPTPSMSYARATQETALSKPGS